MTEIIPIETSNILKRVQQQNNPSLPQVDIYQNINAIQAILKQIKKALSFIPQNSYNTGPKELLSTKNQKIIPTLKKIQTHLSLDDQVFVYALILADKYSTQYDFFITEWNCYKLLVIFTIISDKFLNDENIALKSYSLISKIPIQELEKLEQKVLEDLDYKIILTEKEFHDYKQNMIRNLQE